MEIISKSEAQAIAKQMRDIPDIVIEDVNKAIAKGYANDLPAITFSKPGNIDETVWRALLVSVSNKGYTVKAESAQRDGQWMRITL